MSQYDYNIIEELNQPKLIEALRIIGKGLKAGYALDLHSGNVMVRQDMKTLVIIDPYSGRRRNIF